MSVHIPRIRRCWRQKVVYLSEGEAQKKLDRNPEWGRGMHPYYCGDCDCWHVGHSEKRGWFR